MRLSRVCDGTRALYLPDVRLAVTHHTLEVPCAFSVPPSQIKHFVSDSPIPDSPFRQEIGIGWKSFFSTKS